MFWYRILSDKNQWYADFPYIEVGGKAQPYPGFNQLNNTYNSKQLQNFQIPSPGGGFWNDDISNGRGAEVNYFGSNLDLKFDGGWRISNTFLFDGGWIPTNALVNDGNPQTLTAFIAGLSSITGILTPAQVQAHYANGGAVPGNKSVITQQVWQGRKKATKRHDGISLGPEEFCRKNLSLRGIFSPYNEQEDLAVVRP